MSNSTDLKRIYCTAIFIILSAVLAASIRPAFGAGLIPGLYGSDSSVTAPSVSTLPSLRNIVQGVSSLEYPDDNQLIVHQNNGNAVIEWDSFNIGADAQVHFDQQGKGVWKALNRIYDRNPSLIYGKLTGDGNIYLINQNGIFFSPDSRINVGALVASSLNIADDDFLNGTLSFRRENYIDPGQPLEGYGAVSNHGTIEVDDFGSVFLLGAYVENNGDISAYLGWAALAAGDEVDIYQEERNEEIYNIVSVKNGGDVFNYEDGKITADVGQAGMYGKNVTQDGMIRSITAVRKSGRIELKATDKVILGDNSVTSSPVSDSIEKVHQSFPFDGGNIIIGGLDDEHPLDRIEHYGSIQSPSGSVVMDARDRIYLGETSEIDTGGLWVDRPVSEKLVEVQLNSVELRDDYGQKDGILSGATVNVSLLSGSSIGDVENYFTSEEKTARELALKGGDINLNAGSGDIIFRENAILDVSGGGINYSGGSIDSTKLVSANGVVYDISDAPEWESYTGILGVFEKKHERFGITDEYTGIYYGGAAPVSNYADRFQEGRDAGFISLIGSGMVLDGKIDGSVTQGKYQLYYPSIEDEALFDAIGISVPKAGILEIGDTTIPVYYWRGDPGVEEIVVGGSFDVLPKDFDSSSQFPEEREGKTYVSASLINDAGLDTLRLYSRTGLNISKDAEIRLAPGGYFDGRGRSIIHEGEISVPGGQIDLKLQSNITTDAIIDNKANPEYVSQDDLGHERIFLASGSSLSVAGEKINNLSYGNKADLLYESGILDGGDIRISDETVYGEGVIVREDASIDVSGGYDIDEKGKISGGNAGMVDIHGVTVLLDGDLNGYSLPGLNGGSISLHSASVSVRHEKGSSTGQVVDVNGDIPESMKYNLALDDDYFKDTGFASITLKAFNGIEINTESLFTPSSLKFYLPLNDDIFEGYEDIDSMSGATYSGIQLFRPADEYLGISKIDLRAGENFEGEVIWTANLLPEVSISSGSEIDVFPGGSVFLRGSRIESAGKIYAPGGDIELDAEGVTLLSGGIISAKGYVLQGSDPLVTDLPPNSIVNDGGSVTLNASNYDIVIESGATVDVSGSEPVINYTWDQEGNVIKIKTAGSPGTVSLSFKGSLLTDGELLAESSLAGLNGGTLNINRMSVNDPLEVSGDYLSSYLAAGFDSINLTSRKEITFTDSENLNVGRRLILDAPIISGADSSSVSIKSPWITLRNNYDYYEGKYQGKPGDAVLTLEGDFIDVNGYVTLSSFENVNLISENDIRLSDYYYTRSGHIGRWGGLEQTGDLTLAAERIYPESLASFSIVTGGDLTILKNGDDIAGTLYSAGGNLELTASNIYHYGNIQAPLGTISLNADSDNGIVFLGEDSSLSTYTDARIKYGLMDETGVFWGLPMDSGAIDPDSPVESVPAGSISVEGKQVVMADGSEIDVSGGGSVFAYQFLPGVEGSADPLKNEHQYIILPDNSVYNPGETIVIGENDLIAPGEYYLLSEEYAFTEGALVLKDLGTDLNLSANPVTEEHYSVIPGKTSIAGSTLESPEKHYYSLRSAEDLLSEGYFETAELETGDGGNVLLKGSTTVIEGNITGKPLDDTFSGGTLDLSGTRVILTSDYTNKAYSLPDDFDPLKNFQSQVSPDLVNKLVLSDASISDQGMEKVILGDSESTLSLDIEQGVNLELHSIELNARDTITVNDNSVIKAISENGDGVISFNIPGGALFVSETSLIHASDNVNLDAGTIDFRGTLQVDNSSVSLTGSRIYFVPDNYRDYDYGTVNASYITQSLWTLLSRAETVKLGNGSEILFDDSFNLDVSAELILNASLFETGNHNIGISAGKVTLTNSGNPSGIYPSEGSGKLLVQADEIYLSRGVFTFGGFSEINLNSSNDVMVQGTGGIITGNADLNIEGAGITSSVLVSDDRYDAMDYSINAGYGSFTLASNGNSYGNAKIAGGSFELTAASISSSGVLNMPGGHVSLRATGSNNRSGLFLDEGAFIYATGNEYAPGGTVRLASENGIVNLSSGSGIDVSGGTQGDAGRIEIYSPSQTAVIDGYVRGNAGAGGAGGDFSLDTATVDDLGSLADVLDQGGFSGKLEIRARQGDIVLPGTATLTADSVTISADGKSGTGNIDISGNIDTSGAEDAPRTGLFAAGDLTLYSGSSILGGSGADIMLSGMNSVTFEQGAVIDAGNSDDTGSVTFRSMRTEAGADMLLQGSVTGAGSISAEAVKIYDESSHDGYIDNEIAGWKNETDLFMSGAAAVKNLIFNTIAADEGTVFYLLPGIEIRSSDDLTVDRLWDLTGWRYDADGNGTLETGGALSFRTSGNLLVMQDIRDTPTGRYSLWEESELTGWNIGLYGGSDLSAANPMETVISCKGGNITLGDGALIYTERGDINFYSGGDTTLNLVDLNSVATPGITGFNLGTYSGSVNGKTGGSLVLNGGAIQSSKENISIEINKDLLLKRNGGYLGTIRSYGYSPSASVRNYWEYQPGGNINLAIGGDAIGVPTINDAWDASYYNEWAASYEGNNGRGVAQGIVAMSGGNINITAGGSISAGVGTFGKGNLTIFSGHNLDGRFLVTDGTGEMYAAGDFGKKTGLSGQPIELFDAQVSLTTGGNIELGTILNPTLASDKFTSDSSWNLGYTTETGISLNAISGDVLLTGDTRFYGNINQKLKQRIIPANLSIYAGRDILLNNSFIMTPSADGQLILSAGRDINGQYTSVSGQVKRASIYMSDLDPADIYGNRTSELSGTSEVEGLLNSFTRYLHDKSILHRTDINKVSISAGQDIRNVAFYLPKFAWITAGRDIRDIYYLGQNIYGSDVSLIQAGADISFSSSLSGEQLSTSIVHGGPGLLIVNAGNSMDLGTTDGIQLVGNQYNPYLNDSANNLLVLTGLGMDQTFDGYRQFFNAVREAGSEYSNLLADGSVAEAEEVVNQVRSDTIDPLISGSQSGTGDIDMVDSQINITGSPGGIYLLAMGEINVGKTTFSESGSVQSDSGIYTTAGGSVNIFSMGNLNVNESRVMTFAGGDIMVWSDRGDINAGRGSKISVNATQSQAVFDEATGTWSVVFEAPAVGSGIRTLTFDPDGLEGPEVEPLAGDVYLFAPEGEIDAGEAGVSGTRVTLGATEILNAQNINFSQGSVGVPSSSATVNLGGLVNISNIADMGSMTEEATSSISKTREDAMKDAMKTMEDFITRWLNVEVIGFYEEDTVVN